jgi:hypothetical protein
MLKSPNPRRGTQEIAPRPFVTRTRGPGNDISDRSTLCRYLQHYPRQ